MSAVVQRVAQPVPGTVRNVRGDLCPAATDGDYPLYAVCGCGRPIKCIDSTADWHHTSDYRSACPVMPS